MERVLSGSFLSDGEAFKGAINESKVQGHINSVREVGEWGIAKTLQLLTFHQNELVCERLQISSF